MSLVLLFFSASPPPAATIATVYGADLDHWWFQTYDGTTWTDDPGVCDVTQGTANRCPTATTTPAAYTALSFDVVSGQQDALLSSTGASYAGGTCSAQYGFAFYAPASTAGSSFANIFQTAQTSGWIQFYWSINYNCSVFGSATGSLDAYILRGAWNTVVIDVRGGADASTNGFNVYVNGVKVYAHSGATTQDPATKYALSQDDFTFGGTTDDLAFQLCSPYAAYRTSDFTLDTTALAAAAVLKGYIGGFLTERPPPVWFPSAASDVRRPRFDAHLQMASAYDFAAANPPLTPVALTEHPTVPQRPTPRTTFPSFAMNSAPERTAPLADVQWPDFARRPAFIATWQLAAAPRPEQQVVAPDVVFPDTVRRPTFGAAWQFYSPAIYPQPERTSPLAAVVFPERVPRPTVPTNEQPFVTGISPAPERSAPVSDVEWPDFARRPFFAASSQLAVTEQTPQPERTSPLASAIFPDRAPRALFGTWLAQTTIDSNWPVPAPTVGYAEFPASARRPFYDAARQHAATTEPSVPPGFVVAPTQGYVEFPAFVLRPKYAATEQLAVTEQTPQPERQTPLADVEWPDFARRPFFGAWQQLPATEETPAPERTAPLAWVFFADRVDRPVYAASNQRAYTDATFAPTPYLNATGLTVFPDGVVRPKYAAALQQAYGDDTAAVFAIPFVQQVGLTQWPDFARRPWLPIADQPFASAANVRPERTAPLADAEWPDFARRAVLPTADQPFVSAANVAPERKLASFDVGFPDSVRKPFVPASSQPFVSSANIRPERQVVAFDVLFPEFVRRPMFPATEQLAATEMPPAPERTIDSFDVWYPASVRRPALLAALQLAVTEETPSPVALLAPKPFAVEFPASVRKPALHASQQLDSVMPWARAVQAAVPVPYSTTSFPDYVWRAWSPANLPALSSGISVFSIAAAPNGRSVTGFSTNPAGIEERSVRGSATVPTAHPSVRVRVVNGSIVIRTNTSRAKE